MNEQTLSDKLYDRVLRVITSNIPVEEKYAYIVAELAAIDGFEEKYTVEVQEFLKVLSDKYFDLWRHPIEIEPQKYKAQ